MQKAFDTSLIRRALQRGVDQGYWTVQDLSKPTPSWRDNLNVDRSCFPAGYIGINYKNLLQDDLAKPTETTNQVYDLPGLQKAQLPQPKQAIINDDPF
jgi:hypothetical protein